MSEISVIVPVYKVEKYISRCIDSILKQSFTDFELILVDDGSPDNSGKICDEYAKKDNRIHVVHKKNGGVSSARNAGLDIAQGKYVAFIDSDDYVLETYLSDLFEPDYDLCIISYKAVDINNDFLYNNTVEELQISRIDTVNAEELKQRVYACWSKLYIRDLIENHNIRFDETCSMGEDTIFSMDYISVCESVITKNICSYVYVRYETDSLTTTYNVNNFSGYEKTELYITGKFKEIFGVDFSADTEKKIMAHYAAWFLKLCISVDSFSKQKQVYTYFYHNKFFVKCLNNCYRYFPDISPLTKFIIRLRCPTLTTLYFRLARKKT